MSDHASMPQPRHDDPAARRNEERDDAEALARHIADTALDKKALDLVVIDVRGKASYADFLVICSGRNDRHVLAIADAVDEAAGTYRTVVGREGLASGQWVLLDFGDVIAHVFYGPSRRVYDLDRLWADAPRLDIDIPEDLRGDDGLYEGYDVQ